MATKTTFDFNSENITNSFQKGLTSIQKSTLKISSKSGKTLGNIPLVFAIIFGIIFPFLTVGILLLSILNVIRISVEREESNTNKMIELK